MAVQTKAIKQRIRSVRNTKKITKAMELVAASKVRKMVGKTLKSRPYAQYSWNVLSSIMGDNAPHPLVEANDSQKTLVVLITSNRGLCGAYNAQVIRSAISLFQGNVNDYDVVTIGKKGDTALRRMGAKIVASFVLSELVRLYEVLPIADFLVQQYTKKAYGKVLIIYTDYVSALVQTPNVRQLLPFVSEDSLEEKANAEYIFEPDQHLLFDAIVEKIIHTQLYTMLLEAFASEESSRMLAMKNASDAAGEMIDELTLSYNKIRQAGITQEISEISAGMTSIS